MYVYVASSWRNEYQPLIVNILQSAGYEVYDFRNPTQSDQGFHWSEIDPDWWLWDAREFRDSLSHPLAENGFAKDMAALQKCDVCVLVSPCGRSAHLELGWACGAGKKTVIMLAKEEPELMYKMAQYLCVSTKELLEVMEDISRT
jgi:hypothetical protein